MVTERSPGGTLAASENEPDRGRYVGRKPVSLVLLLVLAVVFFIAVSGLSRVYHAQQEALGNRWFARGVADLKAQRFDRAVSEFRTALLYSRDNYDYQLNLAQALIGAKRTNEADAYLINLWEREPENGLVNLELARSAAQKGQTDQALRYYHNAIYATWPGDQEVQRSEARLELIKFLLSINAKTEAQSELIALAANLDGDPSQHALAGDLFLRTQDYEHALAEYHFSLKSDRSNPDALAGAGWAAFELGRYPLAQKYLEGAVSANPSDAQSSARLKTTELVLQMDPFQRKISVAQRNQIVIEAFASAGQRLKDCPVGSNSTGTGPSAGGQPSLSEKWAKMKGQINERSLRRNPDLVEEVMDLVFSVERQTSAVCGTPTGTDLALLLIAKLHEGN
ncbi:MAG TPA: tetratricopeptide repeat protein [Terriglobales bacterium]|jgi:tetratricopeptide (TPR) repeat protein|nr:tetratricopeptide repeat protein [Terriglobales bacterium]